MVRQRDAARSRRPLRLGGGAQIFESEVVADMRTEELESRVTGDVSMTLHLFNSIVPSLVRGAVTMVRQASELYQRRDAVDLLAVLRPTVVGVLSELGNEARLRLVEERQYVQVGSHVALLGGPRRCTEAARVQDQRTTAEMARVVSNIVDGLPEVQGRRAAAARRPRAAHARLRSQQLAAPPAGPAGCGVEA